MQVFKITEEQKNLLIGQKWDSEQYFNPVIDANGNYFVSQEEVNGCDKPEFQWIHNLPLIPYNPVIREMI